MGLFRFLGFGKNKQEFISLDELYKIFEEEWKRTPHYLHAVDLASKVLSNKAKLSNQDHATLDWCNSVILAKDDEFREMYWKKIQEIYSNLVNYENFVRDISDEKFHDKYYEGIYINCACAGDYEGYKGPGVFQTYCKLAEIFVKQFKKADKPKYFQVYVEHSTKNLANYVKENKNKRAIRYFKALVKIFNKA